MSLTLHRRHTNLPRRGLSEVQLRFFHPLRVHFGELNLTYLDCMLCGSRPGSSNPERSLARGSSVALHFVLVDDGDVSSESYLVLTVQQRVAAGSLSMAELLAGMVDDERSVCRHGGEGDPTILSCLHILPRTTELHFPVPCIQTSTRRTPISRLAFATHCFIPDLMNSVQLYRSKSTVRSTFPFTSLTVHGPFRGTASCSIALTFNFSRLND